MLAFNLRICYSYIKNLMLPSLTISKIKGTRYIGNNGLENKGYFTLRSYSEG